MKKDMKISIVIREIFLKNNGIFNSNLADSSFWEILRVKLLEHQIEIATNDVISENKADLAIYVNLVTKPVKKSFLIAFESIAVLPKLHSIKYINKFSKIFTNNNILVDNVKVFMSYLSYDLFTPTSNISFNKRKLILNISSNKYSSHKDELYSKRVEFIKFLEKNCKDEFSLYGSGWDTQFKFPHLYSFYKKFSLIKGFGLLNRILLKTFSITGTGFLFYDKHDTYKGSVKNKLDVMRLYKFNICFENVYGIDTYISEKIFDCFKSGVIPIYLGSSDVQIHIPKNTFIDYRDFSSLNDLYDFIYNMDENKFKLYLKNAAKFIKSEEALIFKNDYNVDILLNQILKTLKIQKC